MAEAKLIKFMDVVAKLNQMELASTDVGFETACKQAAGMIKEALK